MNNNFDDQVEAAKLLGVNQPKISALTNAQLSGFSIERLIQFLNRLKAWEASCPRSNKGVQINRLNGAA